MCLCGVWLVLERKKGLNSLCLVTLASLTPLWQVQVSFRPNKKVFCPVKKSGIRSCVVPLHIGTARLHIYKAVRRFYYKSDYEGLLPSRTC